MTRIAVIGTGMIGTSILLAVRERMEAVIVGYDQEPRAMKAAGMEPAASVWDAASDSDLVFVSVPVEHTAAVATEALAAGAATVTDVGSVKAPIVRALAGKARSERFVGGHPMAGSERSGPGAATASLFDGVAWVLTPVEGTEREALAAVEDVVGAIGARPVRLAAEEHDRLVGVTSHLPQVLAWALARTVGERREPALRELVAGGFLDTARLAASDPYLWAGILTANADAVGLAMEAFSRSLEALAELIRAGDPQMLAAELQRAREDHERMKP